MSASIVSSKIFFVAALISPMASFLLATKRLAFGHAMTVVSTSTANLKNASAAATQALAQTAIKPTATIPNAKINSTNSFSVTISSAALKAASLSSAPTSISVVQALALNTKVGGIKISDTSANIAANFDKLEVLAKAKRITSITVSDPKIALIKISAAQLKADVNVLKTISSDYKLNISNVGAADVAKITLTKNLYSIDIRDSTANILKNIKSIQAAVSASQIQSVAITDTANVVLTINDAFILSKTLPNVSFISGIKINIKDTASNVIAHARDDIGDVIKNAANISITDKKVPNLTLEDAKTLKGIPNLEKTTKYNINDGGTKIAAQASIIGETILSNAATVTINKNFTISEAKAIQGIKALAKGTVYSIADSADNILKQTSIQGDKILTGAINVNVSDTYANIVSKIDALEVLARAGKIADIKFTDVAPTSLNLTQDQLLSDSEAIGKIISPYLLPSLIINTPNTPKQIGTISASPLSDTLPLSANVQMTSADGNSLYGNFITDTGETHLFKAEKIQVAAPRMLTMARMALPMAAAINMPVAAVANPNTTWNFIDLTPDVATTVFNTINPDLNIIYGSYTNKDGTSGVYAMGANGQFVQYEMINGQVSGYSQDGNYFWGSNTEPPNGTARFFKADLNGNISYPTNPDGQNIGGNSVDGVNWWGLYNPSQGITHLYRIDANKKFTDLIPDAVDTQIQGSNKDGSIWGIYHTSVGPWTGFYSDASGKIIQIGRSDLSVLNIEYVNKDKNGNLHFAGTCNSGYNVWYYDESAGFKTPNTTSSYANISGINSDGTALFGRIVALDGGLHLFKFDVTNGFVDCTPNSGLISNVWVSDDKTQATGTLNSSGVSIAFVYDFNNGLKLLNELPGSSGGGIANDNSYAWGYHGNNLYIYKSNGDLTEITDLNISQIDPGNANKNFLIGQSNNRFAIIKIDGTINYYDFDYAGSGSVSGSKDKSIFWVNTNQNKAYIIDNSGNAVTLNSDHCQIDGIAKNNSVLYGFTRDSNGNSQASVFNWDGTVISVAPSGAVSSAIIGIADDGSKVWGYYDDQNGSRHSFISSIKFG